MASFRIFAKVFDAMQHLCKWLTSLVCSKKSEDHNDFKNNLPRKYENIGPTAALVAYYRAFSDIPFAKEVSEAIQAKEIAKDLIVNDEAHLAKVFIAFEARFKSIDAALNKYPQITQIIEIPSGFSTRGVTMTAANPTCKYIECDLPLVIQEKKKLVAELLPPASKGKRLNLHFCAASVLDIDQLYLAISHFDEGPIAIITEGLFSYLTPQEKSVAAKNVHTLLKRNKGVWIVTDLTRIFKPSDSKAAELRERISTKTGFSPITGCFASISEAKKFFEDFGFIVHDYRRSEVIDSLSTIKTSKLTKRQISKLLEPQATFVLEV